MSSVKKSVPLLLHDVIASLSLDLLLKTACLLLVLTFSGVTGASSGSPNKCLRCHHESVSGGGRNTTRSEAVIQKYFNNQLRHGDANCLHLSKDIEEVNCPLAGKGACEFKSISITVKRGHNEQYRIHLLSRDCKVNSSDDRVCYPADTGNLPFWIADLRNKEPDEAGGPRFAVDPPLGRSCYCNVSTLCNNQVEKMMPSSATVAPVYMGLAFVGICAQAIAFLLLRH